MYIYIYIYTRSVGRGQEVPIWCPNMVSHRVIHGRLAGGDTYRFMYILIYIYVYICIYNIYTYIYICLSIYIYIYSQKI